MLSATMRYMMPNASAVPMAKANVIHTDSRNAAVFPGPLAILENIAHSADGVNQRLIGVAVHLAAHAVDVNVHDVGSRIDPHLPYMIENHRAGHDASGIAAEILEQDEFLWSQPQRLAV